VVARSMRNVPKVNVGSIPSLQLNLSLGAADGAKDSRDGSAAKRPDNKKFTLGIRSLNLDLAPPKDLKAAGRKPRSINQPDTPPAPPLSTVLRVTKPDESLATPRPTVSVTDYGPLKQELQLAHRVRDWELAMELICRSSAPVRRTSDLPDEPRSAHAANDAFHAYTECIGVAAHTCALEEEEECVAWLLAHPHLAPAPPVSAERKVEPGIPRARVSGTQFTHLARSAAMCRADGLVLKLYDQLYVPPHLHRVQKEGQLAEGVGVTVAPPPKKAILATIGACDRAGDWVGALHVLSTCCPSAEGPPSTAPGGLDSTTEVPTPPAPAPSPGAEVYAVLLATLERLHPAEAKRVLLAMPKEDRRVIVKAYASLIHEWGSVGRKGE
jgi:hypothetical protein